MSNIITHPRFDRPKVHQPCPRRRKGTISFKFHRYFLRDEPAKAERDAQARERGERLAARWADLRQAEIVPLHIPNSGMEAFAIIGALQAAGLSLDFDTKRNAIVLYAREPLEPRPAS